MLQCVFSHVHLRGLRHRFTIITVPFSSWKSEVTRLRKSSYSPYWMATLASPVAVLCSLFAPITASFQLAMMVCLRVVAVKSSTGNSFQC